jgi:hypothetical protein
MKKIIGIFALAMLVSPVSIMLTEDSWETVEDSDLEGDDEPVVMKV